MPPDYLERMRRKMKSKMPKPKKIRIEGKKICPSCDGRGYNYEHCTGVYSHDENGECLGYCPVQVACERCLAVGIITPKEGKK